MIAGYPSYRTLAKHAGRFLHPPRGAAASTVRDAFNRDRKRLDVDLLVAIVRALGVDEEGARRWRSACILIYRDSLGLPDHRTGATPRR
jgi:hypothetical protein